MSSGAPHTDCRCPHCHSQSTISHYWTLFLTLEGWPVALLFLAVINIFGAKLGIEGGAVAAFSIAACVPLCFSVVGKSACQNCEIEFERTSSSMQKAVPIQSPAQRGNRKF